MSFRRLTVACVLTTRGGHGACSLHVVGVVTVCSCSSVQSRVRLSAAPWTVARQAPLSMGLSRQAYWSGLPFSPPGVLPDPGIEPVSPLSPLLQVDYLPLNHRGSPLDV